MSSPLLFTPMKLRGLTLRNRIVVAPMHQYAAVKGFPTDWHLMNAGRYAAGGAGLVMMESTKVERRGCGTVGDLGLWDDAFSVSSISSTSAARRWASSWGTQGERPAPAGPGKVGAR